MAEQGGAKRKRLKLTKAPGTRKPASGSCRAASGAALQLTQSRTYAEPHSLTLPQLKLPQLAASEFWPLAAALPIRQLQPRELQLSAVQPGRAALARLHRSMSQALVPSAVPVATWRAVRARLPVPTCGLYVQTLRCPILPGQVHNSEP